MEPFSCRPHSPPARLRRFLLFVALVAVGCGPAASVDRAVVWDPGVPGDGLGPADGGADGGLAPAQAAEAGVAEDASGAAPAMPDASLPVDGSGQAAGDAAAGGPAPTVPDAAVDTAAPDEVGGTTPDPGSSTPPRPDAGPPPPTPTGPRPPVVVEVIAPPAPIPLSTLGIRDWMHFGYTDAGSVTRKGAVTPALAMRRLGDATPSRYDDRPVEFSWSDGTPTPAVAATRAGVALGEAVGSGFAVEIPGDPARRQVAWLFVGAWGATARLTVTISNDRTPVHVDTTLTAGSPGADRVYQLSIDPLPAGATVVASWTLESTNRRYGNVTLSAVALAPR